MCNRIQNGIFMSVCATWVKLVKHECFSKESYKMEKTRPKKGNVDMKSFSWSTLFLNSHRDDWHYSSANITHGSSLHLHLKSVLKCWLTVSDAAVSQPNFACIAKISMSSTTVLFAVYADVRYVLHLHVRKTHLMLMVIPPLICWALGFDSRRENLIENKTRYACLHIGLPIYSRGLVPTFLQILCFLNVCSAFHLCYTGCEAHIRHKSVKRR